MPEGSRAPSGERQPDEQNLERSADQQVLEVQDDSLAGAEQSPGDRQNLTREPQPMDDGYPATEVNPVGTSRYGKDLDESSDPADAKSNLESDEQQRLEQIGAGVADIVRPDSWAVADSAERMQMLERAHQYVAAEYGLTDSPPLSYSPDLEPGTESGEFDPDSREIILGDWLLTAEEPFDAVETIGHENYHDFQGRVIDGELSHPAAADWSKAAAEYGDFVDFEDYASNRLESDAFAAEAPFMSGYRQALEEDK